MRLSIIILVWVVSGCRQAETLVDVVYIVFTKSNVWIRMCQSWGRLHNILLEEFILKTMIFRNQLIMQIYTSQANFALQSCWSNTSTCGTMHRQPEIKWFIFDRMYRHGPQKPRLNVILLNVFTLKSVDVGVWESFMGYFSPLKASDFKSEFGTKINNF